MSSLFGTLNLGARALQTHSQGLAVAGQNLANVNNSAYTRQRLVVQTSVTQESPIGPQGTGVTGVAIERIQNAILDRQIQTESSVGGFWNAQQAGLASAQTELGELINSTTQTAGGTSASAGVGAQSTLATDLSGLFTGSKTSPPPLPPAPSGPSSSIKPPNWPPSSTSPTDAWRPQRFSQPSRRKRCR